MSIELTDSGGQQEEQDSCKEEEDKEDEEEAEKERRELMDVMLNSEGSESESACTILQQQEAVQSVLRDDDQILSAHQLIEQSITPTNDMVEIELDAEPHAHVTRAAAATARMFSQFNHQQELPPALATFRQQFTCVESANGNINGKQPEASATRLCITSQRVKEYFESLRSHSGETKRLYQFFKSIRTELVACLLFSLITSQALIVCRSQLMEVQLQVASSSSGNSREPQAEAKLQTNFQAPFPVQTTLANRVQAQLGSGLAMALTVATLTQIFGHISGCHLIPAVSFALYLKGHISRARLASYLAAQSAGSLLGVALLALLTSSQLTVAEYRQLFGYVGQTTQAALKERQHDSAIGQSNVSLANVNQVARIGELKRQLDRQRRSTGTSKGNGSENYDINLNDIQGSETILLSIMEHQQEERRQRLGLGGSKLRPASSASSLEGKTITVNASTYQVGAVLDALGAGLRANASGMPTNDYYNDGDSTSAEGQQQRLHSGANNKLPPPQTRIKRRKRIRRQQYNGNMNAANATANQASSQPGQLTIMREAGTAASQTNPAERYLNLLDLALPDPIMSSESIRQCFERCSLDNSNGAGDLEASQASSLRLAAKGFNQCLVLSNSSQMFVFQLLATLITVLAYLVNVEPRRVDVGFKSLSIGLAFFVANVLSCHSGGFFPNPFHFLALSWLAPISVWQSEWFIYLITPLIGGLFGAMSHDYIDFTSPRNRNKQLHLRRSFYSLDNIQSSVPAVAIAMPQLIQSQPQARQLQADEPFGRRKNKLSPSSSLESTTNISSTLTSAANLNLNDAEEEDGEENGKLRNVTLGSCMSGSPRRKWGRSAYARQLRLERQCQLERRAATPRRHNINNNGTGNSNSTSKNNNINSSSPTTTTSCMSLRRSDFDSNFLISCSTSPCGTMLHA